MNAPVVFEISGADSIAAALRFAEENPDVHSAIPTYATAPTEFGDFSGVESNLQFLAEELANRTGMTLQPLQMLSDPALWRALNGRYSSALTAIFGDWTPCAGCHLYFHLLRIPTAREANAPFVVSGERVRHGERVKPNQTARALHAYSRVLAYAGLHLAYPVRDATDPIEIEAVLGPRWPGGSPQMECALSGNYAGIDGCCAMDELPNAFFDDFLVPVGERLAAMLPASSTTYETIVAEQLRPLVKALS